MAIKVSTQCHTLNELLYQRMVINRRFQKDVAAEIGTDASTISRIVNGKGFELKLIIPIARWCGIGPQELWELLDGTSNPSPDAEKEGLKHDTISPDRSFHHYPT